MLENIRNENVLFLDIETVPAARTYEELNEEMRALWDRKSESYYMKRDEISADEAYERAGIYAEFGRIICISVGVITKKGSEKGLRIKSFYGDDEQKLLKEFNSLLDKHYFKEEHYLCAHNGKEFDFPYIARRSLINDLRLPVSLDIAGKKPWEVKHLDTMELWKFGDYKHYTPLRLLTAIFGIPTPKDDIDGSDVARVYWEDNDLQRIVEYCQKDVTAIVQLFLKFKSEELIKKTNIEIIA